MATKTLTAPVLKSLAIAILLISVSCKKSDTTTPSSSTPTAPTTPAYSFLVTGGSFLNTPFLKGASAIFYSSLNPTKLAIIATDTVKQGNYVYAYTVIIDAVSPSTGTFNGTIFGFSNGDNLEYNLETQEPSVSSNWSTGYANGGGSPETNLIITISAYSSSSVTGTFSIAYQNGATTTGSFFLPITIQ